MKGLVSDPTQPALFVDSGNLLFKADTLPPETVKTATSVAEGVLQATRKMGGTLAGVGSRDLAAGLDFLRKQHSPPAFTWLSLNVVDPVSGKPLFTPVLFKQAGTLKIAILALTDHNLASQQGNGFKVVAWRDVLPRALTALQGKADFILLLSNYSVIENKVIAETCHDLDLILQSGHVAGNMQPFQIAQTLIAQTDTKGKYLGVLDINWQIHGHWNEMDNPSQPPLGAGKKSSSFSNRFIAITPSIASDPEIDAIVQQSIHNTDIAQRLAH